MFFKCVLLILVFLLSACNVQDEVNLNTITFENQEFIILKEYDDSVKIMAVEPIAISNWDTETNVLSNSYSYMNYNNSYADILCEQYYQDLPDETKKYVVPQIVTQKVFEINSKEDDDSVIINKYMCQDKNICNTYSFKCVNEYKIGKRYAKLVSIDDLVDAFGNDIYDYEIKNIFKNSNLWLMDASSEVRESPLKINGSMGLISMYTYIFNSEIRPVLIVYKEYFEK